MKLKTIYFLPFIALLAWPAYRFLLQPGFFTTMDGHIHLYKAIELNRGLTEGQFPVRWGSNFAYGYGLPIFNFYSPLFYYLTGIFNRLGWQFVDAAKTLLTANFVLAGIMMFLLTKEFFGKWAGLVSGIIYIYAPYFFVNVYVRGAFPEALTFSLIPLAFWSFTKYFKTDTRWSLLLAGLSIGLMPLTHNFLSLITIPFLLTYILLFTLKTKNINGFLAFGFGFLSSSFFWLPVLLEQKFLLPEVFTNNYDYRDSFLYPRQLFYSAWGYEGNVKGPDDGFSLMIGYPLVFLAFGAWIFLFNLKKKTKVFFKFFYLSFLICCLMTLSISAWVWRLIPPLQVAQFPWRYLVLIVFFGSWMAGSVVLIFNRKTRPIAALAIAGLAILLNYNFAKAKDHIGAYSDRTFSGHHLGIPRAPVIGDDFTPAWVTKRPEEAATNLIEPTNFQPEFFQGHHYSFSVDLDQPQVYTFNTYYYPGWTGYIDGQKKEVGITDNGLFELEVPAGQHQVDIIFRETPLRQTADYLSLVGLGGLVVLSLIGKRISRKAIRL